MQAACMHAGSRAPCGPWHTAHAPVATNGHHACCMQEECEAANRRAEEAAAAAAKQPPMHRSASTPAAGADSPLDAATMTYVRRLIAERFEAQKREMEQELRQELSDHIDTVVPHECERQLYALMGQDHDLGAEGVRGCSSAACFQLPARCLRWELHTACTLPACTAHGRVACARSAPVLLLHVRIAPRVAACLSCSARVLLHTCVALRVC